MQKLRVERVEDFHIVRLTPLTGISWMVPDAPRPSRFCLLFVSAMKLGCYASVVITQKASARRRGCLLFVSAMKFGCYAGVVDHTPLNES